MSDLYLIFIAIAVVLFGAIVAYSVYQQRRHQRAQSDSTQAYVDPLFAELEGRTAKAKKPAIDPKSKSKTNSKPDKQESAKKATAKSKLKRSLGGKLRATKKSKTSAAKSSITPSGEVAQAEETTQARQADKSVTKTAPVMPGPKSSPVNKGQTAMGKQASDADPLKGNAIEPKLDNPESAKTEPTSGPPKVDAASSIVTELVARVRNPQPIEQQELLAMFRLHDYKFHRKVHIYGLNELTDLWRDIEFELPSARFVELGVAIQLADRDGAMSKKELHDFQQMALEFSNKFDAPFEFSLDIDEALTQAQILDQIGRRYDSMAVLNVVPRAKTGFRMNDIESCARDLMMSTDKNGIFVKTKGQKHNLAVLYRLACTDGSGHFGISTGAMTPVHDLVIYMNVPAIDQPDRVFQDMVKDANNLATWLDGKVVDRNGRVMTQRSYSILMQQISDIAYSMQQDGLVPGDAVSKKLF